MKKFGEETKRKRIMDLEKTQTIKRFARSVVNTVVNFLSNVIYNSRDILKPNLYSVQL